MQVKRNKANGKDRLAWGLEMFYFSPRDMQRAAGRELRVLRSRWSCWWRHVQLGRCATAKWISALIFKEYWNSSVVSWSHIIYKTTIFSEPPTQRKTTCLSALLKCISNTTRVMWEIINAFRKDFQDIVCQKITKIGSNCSRCTPSLKKIVACLIWKNLNRY